VYYLCVALWLAFYPPYHIAVRYRVVKLLKVGVQVILFKPIGIKKFLKTPPHVVVRRVFEYIKSVYGSGYKIHLWSIPTSRYGGTIYKFTIYHLWSIPTSRVSGPLIIYGVFRSDVSEFGWTIYNFIFLTLVEKNQIYSICPTTGG